MAMKEIKNQNNTKHTFGAGDQCFDVGLGDHIRVFLEQSGDERASGLGIGQRDVQSLGESTPGSLQCTKHTHTTITQATHCWIRVSKYLCNADTVKKKYTGIQ